MVILITLINYITNILIVLVVVDILVGYFLNPFHPVRRALDTIVRPMLVPIQRIMPRTGMVDFSPMILIIVIGLIGRALIWLIGILF